MSGDGEYSIRPNFKQKFRPSVVAKMINQVLKERLGNVTYQVDTCSQLSKEISDEIKTKLKAMDMPRYKFVVHVMIGEMRGEGVRVGCRCLWDADSDNMAQDVFVNVGSFHERAH
ncbi:Tctex-1 family-domain-containing protein [Chytridium lagenaria]|nr:Tctex-1 family-domain-containing protein [Chytridium lagenaria]